MINPNLENNNNNIGNGYHVGNAFGMGSSTSASASAEEYALVKVDYDMPSGGAAGYGAGWSGDSVQASNANAGVFSMWNE